MEETENKNLIKVLTVFSITLSLVILLLFFIQQFGIENIDVEKVVLSLLSTSIGISIGYFAAKKLK